MTVTLSVKRPHIPKPYVPLYTKVGLKAEQDANTASDHILNGEIIRQGLPYHLFEDLQKVLGLSARELAIVTGINERTIARRRGGVLSPEESERLSSVAKVVDNAMFVAHGNEEVARRWFKRPHGMLMNRRPMDLLFSHETIDELQGLLEDFADSVYT